MCVNVTGAVTERRGRIAMTNGGLLAYLALRLSPNLNWSTAVVVVMGIVNGCCKFGGRMKGELVQKSRGVPQVHAHDDEKQRYTASY